jgi:lipopolysaccharide transport system ATP-binding protein
MSDIAIKVEGLGKKYVIGQQKSGDFRNAFGNKLKSLFGRNGSGAEQEFWALQDINFEIKKGEAVGIIGRNGAGKSTLLKILSRITEPTKGRFEINGRVSSLLEVGTGFHMELTGRENIYLNGTILGMRRAEIKKKLDEIIAFSGVEKFLDTPVKHYSSGMKVRLAFSVAAHLEPEILIIDEVLAVGDAEFQKKCLGKMDEVSKNEGRTVLFVSHNMQSITTLTERCIVMDGGSSIFNGATSKSVGIYLSNKNYKDNQYNAKPDGDRPSIVNAFIYTSERNNIHVHGEPLEFEFHLHTPISIRGASFSFQIIRQDETPVMHLWTFDSERNMCRTPGIYKLKCKIEKSRLYLGNYYIKAYFTGPPNTEKFDVIEGICPFRVEMYHNYREFKYQPNACAYIEDSNWIVESEKNISKAFQ